MKRLLLTCLIASFASYGCEALSPVAVIGSLPRVSDQKLRLTGYTGLEIVEGQMAEAIQLTADGQALTDFGKVKVTRVLPGADKPTTSQIEREGFDDSGRSRQKAASVVGSTGGKLYVFVQDDIGQLTGSGLIENLQVANGQDLDVPITQNTAKAKIIASVDNHSTADGVIIRETTLKMDSGYLDGLPGVARVDVEINGPAYAGGNEVALIGTLQGDSIRNYEWTPYVPSGTYDPGKLIDPSTPVPFYLTTKAYDTYGQLVGTTRVDIAIIGTATLSIGFDI